MAQSASPTPAHVRLHKVIGQARTEFVPSLIVLNARGADLAEGTFTLTAVATNSILFTD